MMSSFFGPHVHENVGKGLHKNERDKMVFLTHGTHVLLSGYGFMSV